MEFVIHLQQLSISHGICNLFKINYQFHVELVIYFQLIINPTWNL